MTAVGPGHEQWRESTAAYLLGALDETDNGGFRAHMADCPACRDEITDLRGTVEALALAAPPMAPPPELAARIMRTVQQEADLLRAAGPEADRPLPTRDKRSPWARLTAWMPALSPAFALPAALVVLALGVLAGGELADGGSGNADGRQIVAGQVLDPNSAQDTHVELRLGRDEATLVAERLPQPPPGRVYQVWLKRPGTRPEPTNTLFAPRADGSAVAAVPGSLDGVEAVLVTDEPAGGSRRPSREPILLVNPTA